MTKETNIKLFEEKKVRTIWDEQVEKWWFSVVDICSVLTDCDYQTARKYWKVLKGRLAIEGSELVTNCYQLKMPAPDGKMRLTDVADIEQVLRFIQSIPSKKAEPFKMWLAQVGRERIDETIDPEISIERAIVNYRQLGYSENWINQRIKSIEVRKALTDEWDKAGVKQGEEYAFLTDLITKTWSGMTTKQYKQHKSLKKENLRDNMTNLELIINMLAEATTTELSTKNSPQTLRESAVVAHKGANVAKNTRLEIEQQGGQVISSKNAKQLEMRKETRQLTLKKNSTLLFSILCTAFFFACIFCNPANAQNNHNYHYEVIKMDSTFDSNADLTLETYMYYLKQEKDKKMSQVIGTSKEVLVSFSPLSPLSNLLVDMLFEWGNNYLLQKKSAKADLALLNFGGIRAALPQGNITVGDIFQISPFDNTVAFVFVKGSELRKMFEGFSEKRNAPMANVQTIYQNGWLLSYTIGGVPVENDRIYTIVTINFLALGGDDFLRQITPESILYIDMPVRNVFIEGIRKKTVQDIKIEGVVDDRVIIRPTP